MFSLGERTWIFLKNGNGDFENSPPFERSACFYVTAIGNFETNFLNLSLKLILRKTKTFLKKMEYGFLVQSTKIESAIFPHETALPEANVKTNIGWEVQNGPITKDGVSPVTVLVF